MPPQNLHPTPYTLHPTPYTLPPPPYTLHPTPPPSVRARAGISFPQAVREICNGWKSDLQIQSMGDPHTKRTNTKQTSVSCELLQCSSA